MIFEIVSKYIFFCTFFYLGFKELLLIYYFFHYHFFFFYMFWTVEYIDNSVKIFFMFFLVQHSTYESDFLLEELLPS